MAIITISRGTSTGGTELAQAVSEKLGYRMIAEEVLVKAAKQYGIAVEELQHAIEDKPGFFENMKRERIHALAFVGAALCREIKDEKVVYHGHAGHLFLGGVPHVLRIRVIASMNYRVKKAMEQYRFTWGQAADYIQQADSIRVKWSRYLFNVDTRDPYLYDLVIDVDRVGIMGACEIVSAAAKLDKFQKSPDSQRKLDDFILSTELRAEVARNAHLADERIEITSYDGIIELSGSVSSLEEADMLREFIRKQPGVINMKSQLRAPIQTRVRC